MLLMAEYMGGTCSNGPRKCSKAARMSASLEPVPAEAAARPRFCVLAGLYRTNAPKGAAADVHFDWLFGAGDEK